MFAVLGGVENEQLVFDEKIVPSREVLQNIRSFKLNYRNLKFLLLENNIQSNLVIKITVIMNSRL